MVKFRQKLTLNLGIFENVAPMHLFVSRSIAVGVTDFTPNLKIRQWCARYYLQDSILSCILKILFWSILFYARYFSKILFEDTFILHNEATFIRILPMNRLANVKLIESSISSDNLW